MKEKDKIFNLDNEKDKIVGKNILLAFIIKGGALGVSFFSLPIYIRFFNDDKTLGVWFTILSLLSWFLTFDFGVGNGLRNKLVGSIEKNDDREIKEYISSGYYSLFYLSSLIYIVVIPIFLFLNWNNILNINNISNSVLKITMIINLTTIMSQFLLRLINFILYAIQKSAVNNFITLITSVSQLIIVLLLPSFSNEKNLIVLSLVHLASTIIPLVIATVVIFNKSLKGKFPKKKFYNRIKAKEIFTSGGNIFINQILYMLLTATNVYLITILISPEEVVEYQIYQKIFTLMGTMFTLALTPLWSAVTKAHFEKDFKWIKKYFNITVALSTIVFLGQFIVIIPLQIGFNIWLGQNAPIVNYTYAIIFAIFGGVFTLQNTVSVFAMGLDSPKVQMFFYSIAIIIKVALIFIFIKSYQTWVLIVFVDILAFIPYIIFEFIHVNKIISEKIGITGAGVEL